MWHLVRLFAASVFSRETRKEVEFVAQIDSLEISIESSAKKANDAINSIVKNLGNLSKALNIDTSRLSNIGKSIDLSGIAKQTKSISESMGNMGAKMSQSMKPVRDNAKNLESILSRINEKYKDLGKDFQFFGNVQSVQKKIDSLSNSLENAKIKKQELERAGKTEGQMYENAVKDVIKYGNQIESLKRQISETQTVKISVDTKEVKNAENLIERMKEHIRQQMAGIRIENPVNVAGLNDEQYAMFKKLQEEMQQAGASAKKMGNQIKEAAQETASIGGFGTALVPIEKFMESATDKTKQFEESLKNLQIPPINTTNINILKRELAKAEADFEKLRIKLANGIAMGRISANVDDKGFRTLKEQMYLAEKQAQALRDKIKEVGNTSKTTSGGSNSLSNALKKLSSNANLTSNSINKLTKNLGRSLSGMKSFTRQILSAVGIMGGLYGAIRGGMSAIDIASQLTEVQNVVDVTFGDMAYKVEDFAKTSIEQFGMSELTLKQVSSRFQAMGTAMGFPIDQMSDMSIELTKLTADMSSFYNVEQEDVAKSLESIFTGTTRPLRQYGLDLTQATLQEWALKQGMDADIQSMSQAEKTMLRYQYVLANTGAAQGDFARTVNTWANQVRILKQNFEELASVVGKTLINALKPLVKALNAAMSHVIAFAKTISNSLGKIFGWTFEEGGGISQDFEDASGYADDLADSTGDAAKNIKKMQAGLRAFDELKVINMPNDNDGAGAGGAGGGLGGAGGGALGGNWIQGDSLLKQYESEIDTLYKLGEYISKTLIDAMESIDWDSIYEKARGFGKGLAEFLNGLFAGQNGITLFGEIGKTIASALNAVIYAALSFGETFDFKQFGYNIADGINNFFATFDFAALAQTINVWVQGIWDVIKTAISEIDWGKVWEGVKEFLQNIDIETVGIIVGAITIKKILGLNLASTALSWIGTKISQKIAQAIAGKLGFEIAKEAGIGMALKKGLPIALGKIGTSISTFFATYGATIVKTLGTIGAMIAAAIAGWHIGQWLNEAITGEKIDMTFFEQMSAIKESFSDGSWRDALSLWKDDIVTNLIALADDEAELIKPLTDKIIEFKEIFSDGQFQSAVKLWGDDIYDAFVTLGERQEEKFNEIKLNIVSSWEDVKSKTSEAWNNISSNLSQFWNQTKENAKEKFWGIKNGIINAWQETKQNTAIIWEQIKNFVKSPINAIIGFINRMIIGVVSGINSIANALNSLRFEIPAWVPKFGGKGFGFNIPNITAPQIPYLAKGGVVTRYTPAVIGESGMEAVLPLTNKQTMGMIADSILSNASNSKNSKGYNQSEEISLLRSQNQLIREQNRLLQAILNKPTMEIMELGNRLAESSWMNGGNTGNGGMRLAVAEELY